MIRQALLLLLIAVVFGQVANQVNTDGLPMVGDYREISSGDGPIIPPEVEPGDPPFIDIQVAQFEYAAGKALFVDARDVSEFECGTIPGSTNIPFDYMPEENLEQYLDSALNVSSKDHPIIVFCSGEECDLSLHLGRNLQGYGYTNSSIFFGGAREWETAKLEMERRTECGE
jgi:rhodanese-related sulfurtransferase